MKRKIAAILISLSIASSLSAAYIGGSGGYGLSSFYGPSFSLSAYFHDDSYKVGLASTVPYDIRLSGEYDFRFSHSMSLDLFSSFYHSFESKGGMAHAAINFGQDISASWFHFNYRIGIIGGLDYSIYSDDVYFSITPNFLLELGADISEDISVYVYSSSYSFFETAFQALLITGFRSHLDINGNAVTFDIYAIYGDYLDEAPIIVKDIKARIGFEIRI